MLLTGDKAWQNRRRQRGSRPHNHHDLNANGPPWPGNYSVGPYELHTTNRNSKFDKL